MTALLGAAITTATPASAALPTCFRTANFDTGSIGPIPLPSAGTTEASTSCLMSRGATSTAVRRLQQTLNRCHAGGLAEDSVFGSRTEAALERAQRALGITADGVYGPVTRDHLGWWTGSICTQVDGPGGD